MSDQASIRICLHCGDKFEAGGPCEMHPGSPLVDPSSHEARSWLKAEDDKRFLRTEIIWGVAFAIPGLFLGYVATIVLFGPTDFGPRTTWIVLRPYVFGLVWAAIFFPTVWIGLTLAKKTFKPRFKNWWPEEPKSP